MRTFFTTLALGLALSQPAEAISALHGTTTDNAILPIDTRCSVSAGAPVIDYGTQSRWQLQDVAGGQKVTPGKRMLMVSVVCPHTQTMRLTLRGDRAGNGDLRYGDRGSVSLRLLEAQLDGQNVQVAATTPDGMLSGAPESSLLLQPGNSLVATLNGQPAKGKSFTARIELEPVMPESAARVSARQISESNLTLELMD
ncbi:fimbrial protein [Serratia ureilytica]|uniref:fimbrial protein n=1 Tax=Serratia ureilytica TaxID=300181 RepID=UPI00214F3248|nr:fimbrial protein [Serratia ureilytica]UUW17347.1 fimbrial protein [Serratia ureilytica]